MLSETVIVLVHATRMNLFTHSFFNVSMTVLAQEPDWLKLEAWCHRVCFAPSEISFMCVQ